MKVTPAGALAAVIGGGSAALVIKLFGISTLLGVKYMELGGLLFGALLLFVVSLIENRVKREKRRLVT